MYFLMGGGTAVFPCVCMTMHNSPDLSSSTVVLAVWVKIGYVKSKSCQVRGLCWHSFSAHVRIYMRMVKMLWISKTWQNGVMNFMKDSVCSWWNRSKVRNDLTGRHLTIDELHEQCLEVLWTILYDMVKDRLGYWKLWVHLVLNGLKITNKIKWLWQNQDTNTHILTGFSHVTKNKETLFLAALWCVMKLEYLTTSLRISDSQCSSDAHTHHERKNSKLHQPK